MNKSATAEISVRERRMARTREELTTHARRLTAERGFNGFTIDELCDLVEISRRTFFNYFHSKEDAVLGRPEETLETSAMQEFVDGGDPNSPGLSPTLIDDFVTLTRRTFERVITAPGDVRDLIAAVETEPQLLRRFLQANEEHERMLMGLVAAREGLDADDDRAPMFILLFGGIVKHTADTYFRADNDVPFHELFEHNVSIARQLFSSADHTPNGTPT